MFDNNSYYNRNNAQSKQQLIFDYVKKNDIKTLFDVGCNIGMMSYPIQKKLNVEVFGVDGADKLALPKDYNYEQCDILDYNNIIFKRVSPYFWRKRRICCR
jgi:ribosomal protein L11 methylase PrmA